MTLNKYSAALLQFILILVTSLQASMVGGLDEVEVWQLVAIAIASVGTFFVPLVDGAWAGILKTGVAVLGAIVAALIPVLAGVWTPETTIIILLAGLNALAAQLGVSVRLDAVKAELAAPEISNVVPMVTDPKAVQIVTGRESELPIAA